MFALLKLLWYNVNYRTGIFLPFIGGYVIYEYKLTPDPISGFFLLTVFLLWLELSTLLTLQLCIKLMTPKENK